jgi:outer membrane protein
MTSLRHLVFLVAAAGLAVTPVNAVAEDARPRVLHLSLRDALSLALANNQDVAIAAIAPRRATAEVTRQQAAFDPTLSVSAGIERDRRPQGAAALGTFRDSLAGDIRLNGRLPLGTEYELAYGTARVETDSQLTASSPSSSSFVDLRVRQPLLRNFGREVNEAGIRIARGERRIAEHAFTRRSQLVLADTVAAYWRLVRAHKSLAVARESLRLAEELAQRSQARVAAGDTATIEVTQARASVAAREEAVILGEAEVGNASDALARLVVADPVHVFDGVITPTDDPETAQPASQFGTAIVDAMRLRPELHAAREAVESAEVTLAVAANQRRPDLSAVGAIGLGGLDPRWSDAHAQLATDAPDRYRWSAGLVLSVPLGNRAAAGAHRQASLALQEARLALRSLELEVTEQVRVAVRDLEASRRRIESTRRSAELARAQLSAGERRLEAGLSTAFEILRLQTDLAAAEDAVIAAAVDFRMSTVALHLATGAGLETVVAGQ